MRHGKYVGDRSELTGKCALLRTGPDGTTLAQFDDIETGLGYGWHLFRSIEFCETEGDDDHHSV